MDASSVDFEKSQKPTCYLLHWISLKYVTPKLGGSLYQHSKVNKSSKFKFGKEKLERAMENSEKLTEAKWTKKEPRIKGWFLFINIIMSN